MALRVLVRYAVVQCRIGIALHFGGAVEGTRSERPRLAARSRWRHREAGKAFIGEGEHAGEIKPGTARSKDGGRFAEFPHFSLSSSFRDHKTNSPRSLRRSSLGVSEPVLVEGRIPGGDHLFQDYVHVFLAIILVPKHKELSVLRVRER